MARYNSALISNTITGTATIGSPYSGAFTEFTGTAPYTVTLPTPVAFPGVTQTFYNATSGTVTLSTPSGNFVGTGSTGATTIPIYSGNVVSIVSDGTNYVVISEDGSPLIATTGSFSGNVTINGGSATLSVTSSVVTMAPTASSTIDNIAIGATTRASGAFTTLTSNNAVTFTANTASSSTTTGSLVVTGGIGASGTVYAGAFNGNLTGTLQTASQPNITSVGSLSSLTVAGALAVDTTTLVVDATNDRVGVGTSAPATKLHVSASVTNTGGTGSEILRIANTRVNTGSSGAAISFVTNEVSGTDQYVRAQITGEYGDSSNVNGRLLFATANTSGTLVVRMRLDSSGVVSVLDPGSYAQQLQFYQSNAPVAGVGQSMSIDALTGNGVGGNVQYMGGISFAAYSASTNANTGILAFHHALNGTKAERFRIHQTGNLLFGTTNADIGGSVAGVTIRTTGNNVGSIVACIDSTSPANYESPLALDRRNTAGNGLMIGLWRQGYFQNGIGTTNTRAMTFVTGDGANGPNTEQLRIDPSQVTVADNRNTLSNSPFVVKKDWVSGHATIAAQTVTTNGTVGFGMFNQDATRLAYLYSAGSTGCWLVNSQNSPITFGTQDVDRIKITGAGHLIPAADDTYDLGATGAAWRNIYTNDLHLNNESKVGGNDVDGTTGNWTIQEGADNLYIINNNTGKRFAFVLKELE